MTDNVYKHLEYTKEILCDRMYIIMWQLIQFFLKKFSDEQKETNVMKQVHGSEQNELKCSRHWYLVIQYIMFTPTKHITGHDNYNVKCL